MLSRRSTSSSQRPHHAHKHQRTRTKNLVLEGEYDDRDDDLLHLGKDLGRRVDGRDDGGDRLRDTHRSEDLVLAGLVHDALEVDSLTVRGLLRGDALAHEARVCLALGAG